MSQKWSFFAIGVMAGIIAVLGYALIVQAHGPKAHAQAGGGDTNPQAGITVATGGSQQNINDVCWILYKHQKPQKADDTGGTTATDVTNKTEHLSLACYQVTNNARGLKLVGVRNISWDMDLLELNNEKPSVVDIVKALRDEQKRKEKEKKP